MASRRARTRRDKRAEADEFLGLDEDGQPEDAAFTLANGERRMTPNGVFNGRPR